MAPFSLDSALAELATFRRMWATNSALKEDRTGLERVVYQTQLWLQCEYAIQPEGTLRDQSMKRKLKAVEKQLEEVSGWNSFLKGRREA